MAISAPQSKDCTVTCCASPDAAICSCTAATNSSRGAVSSGAPASTLVSMFIITPPGPSAPWALTRSNTSDRSIIFSPGWVC